MTGLQWFSVALLFENADDYSQVQRFEARASAAASLLDGCVAPGGWHEATGYKALGLLLTDGPSEEPDITDLGVEEGIRSFQVDYHWLADEFLDRGRGSWQLLGVFCVVLATISREEGIPLPRLPVRRP